MKIYPLALLLQRHLLVLAVTLFAITTASAQVSISCPGDINQNNDPGVCGALVNYLAPIGSGSGTGITTTLLSGLPPGSIFDAGTTQITYGVTNNEGDSDECTFFITVNDTEAPTFNCPPDFSVTTNPGECSAIVTFPTPEAFDNCAIFSTFQFGGQVSGSTFALGTHFLDFTSFDIDGNQGFCRVILTVLDGDAPFIECPEDITVSADANCQAIVNYTAPEGVDACLPANTSLTAGLGSGAAFPLGTTVETYTTTDSDGNSASCSFNVIVVDDTPPVITCPADIDIAIDPGNCTQIINFNSPVFTDNCPGATIVQTGGLPSGTSFPGGMHLIEFTATDAAGNSTICSYNYNVTETVVPEITCPADLNVNNELGLCGATVNYTLPIGTDNCPDVVTQLTSGVGSGGFFPVGITTETYTVTDASGNTATCSFTVTVVDSEDPILDCEDVIANAKVGICEAVVNFTIPSATDNCAVNTIIQTNGPPSSSSFPVGSTEVEFTATDVAGNSTICTFNIIVVDNQDPEITCPADFSFTIPGDACSTPIVYPDPTISDNCPGVTFSVVSGPASGDLVTAGIYTIELQAIDAAGNTSNCSFTATIEETSDPVFTCPGDMFFPIDAGGVCEATVVFDTPEATDDCSTVTVAQTGGPPSGDVFPAGSTPVEFTATDAFGNTAVCSFNIIVEDENDPEITCPENIVATTDISVCEAVVNYDPPVTNDNCGTTTVTMTAGMASGSSFPTGETTITYEIADLAGNTAECSFTVTVVDEEDPTVTCPADITVNIPDGDCESVVNYPLPVADDNCAIASLDLTAGLASGEIFPVGTTVVTYMATDISGNTNSCSFNVTVLEAVAPEITCPGSITIDAEPGECSAVVLYTAPVGTDDCGNATTALTAGLGSGASFPVGVTTETYTVTDVSGNQTSCSFTITVVDAENPVITCGPDINASAEAGECSAIITYDLPTVSDNCSNAIVPSLVSGLASGSAFPVGLTTVTYDATDEAGNSVQCSFTVTITDDEVPVITCPDDIEIFAVSGDCEAIVNFAPATAVDNCPGTIVTQTSGPISGSIFPVGNTIIGFTAEDAAGNPSECQFTITVFEDVPPTIVCPDDIIVDNDLGICGAIVTYTEPEGIDNCGDVSTTLTAGLASGSEFPVGTTVVTYTATDFSGNETPCSFNVTVNDSEAPVFDCPVSLSVNSSSDICGSIYSFNLPDATDNCSNTLVITQTEGPVSGSILPVGITTFTYTTQDDAGNPASCSYTVTVVDATPPEFTLCPDDAVFYVEEESCSAVISFDAPLATDNCNVTVSQTSGPESGDLLALGSYPVEFTAVDDAGNSVICGFTVSVADTISPVISCPEGFETCSNSPEFDIPEATDNCAVTEINQIAGPSSGTIFPSGETIITFVAIDGSGNTDTCSFTINVLTPAPIPDAGLDQTICEGTSTNLIGNDPQEASSTWTIIEGAGTIENSAGIETEVTDLGTGLNVFVYILDPENGCAISSDTVNVFVETGVTVDAGENANIRRGESTTLNPTASPEGGTFIWTPPNGLSCDECENPNASPDETTLYYVTYTTALGCQGSDSVLITVFTELPNTITPDGDGVNDVWNIPGIGNYPEVYVVIYNRWGNTVFESTGYNEPWDGTHDGKELPTGSYYYIIDYNSQGVENLSGTVNIIR